MREVTESTLHAFVPEFKETMSEIDEKGIQRNYMVKVYVQGEYLDENVSTDRETFRTRIVYLIYLRRRYIRKQQMLPRIFSVRQ